MEALTITAWAGNRPPCKFGKPTFYLAGDAEFERCGDIAQFFME